MNTIETITLSKLVLSKANVRKTGREEGIAELAQSIAAHGLRQNLNVRATDKGRFEVVAGGRRLRALKLLAKEGLLAVDSGIPCKVIAEGEDAAEISLVENTLRLAMHPDDQFEAFRQLVEMGKGLEEVAARFGVTPAVVERRLKLSKVSPKLRTAFRKGDLTLDQMMAFAVSDDHDRQEDVCRSLTSWNGSPRDIRAALVGEAVALSHVLATFVTVDAYVAAGGVIQRDLFDADNEGYMADRALVLRLAHQKLEIAADGLRVEGWKWVKAEVERDYSVHYGRVYPSYDEVEDDEAGERVARYSAEDMARAGVVLRIGHDGDVVVERGLVHPDDASGHSRQAVEKQPKDPGTLPAVLVKELSAHRTAALQAALTQNPATALAVTVYTLALPLFGHNSGHSCLTLGMKPVNAAAIVPVPDECAAHGFIAGEAAQWAERLPGTPADLFAWCVAQSQEALLSLLAFCAASGVNAVKDKFDTETMPRLTHADALTTVLNLDMATQWQPSVDGFYGRVSKVTLLHMVKEAKIELSMRLADMKKDAAARHVMQAMVGSGWLPAMLRVPETVIQGDDKDLSQAA